MAKARGEGERRRGKFRSSTSTSNFNYKALVAGLIVVIGGGIAAWLMMSGREAVTDTEGNRGGRAIAEAKPQIVTKADSTLPRKPLKERVELSNERLSDGAKESLSQIDLLLRKRLSNTNGFVHLSRPLLKNPTDQLYFAVFNTQLGDMPPMTPFLQEEEEKQAIVDLGVELKVEETDTPQQKEAKALVNDVKKLLDDFIREGGTINEFFDHYCYEIEKAYEFRNMSVRLLNQAVETGDKETAIELEKALNEKLEERGIRLIELTETDMEVMDAIAEETDGKGLPQSE